MIRLVEFPCPKFSSPGCQKKLVQSRHTNVCPPLFCWCALIYILLRWPVFRKCNLADSKEYPGLNNTVYLVESKSISMRAFVLPVVS